MTNEIRRIRKKIGVSAGNLAKLIGSNTCSIYYWEQGKTKPRHDYIMKRLYALENLVDVLKINPDYLIKKE